MTGVRSRTRLHLVLQAAALAALSLLVLLVAGLPLLARRALGPQAFIALVVAHAAALLVVGGWLLVRGVGRPCARTPGGTVAAPRVGSAAVSRVLLSLWSTVGLTSLSSCRRADGQLAGTPRRRGSALPAVR